MDRKKRRILTTDFTDFRGRSRLILGGEKGENFLDRMDRMGRIFLGFFWAGQRREA